MIGSPFNVNWSLLFVLTFVDASCFLFFFFCVCVFVFLVLLCALCLKCSNYVSQFKLLQ